jgi:hypothetical protein
MDYIHGVKVKRKETRHPVPDDVAGGLSPDLVLNDVIAARKWLK